MNKVILLGRLARDPEIRTAAGENGTTIARYTLAVNRRFSRNSGNGEPTADFISCVSFGRTAEFIEKYITKGRQVCVCGRIQTGSYTNQEGQKVYTTEVVVDEVDFADSRRSDDAPASAAPAAAPTTMPSPEAADSAGQAAFATDEEIPFN